MKSYSIDLLCDEEFSQLTGELIVNLLAKESRRALPCKGVLAGQAVTSALLQLCGLPGVVYNDIDLFGPAHCWPDFFHLFPANEMSSFSGNMLKSKFIEENKDFSSETEDSNCFEYIEMSAFIKVENTIKIINVARDGDLNFVLTNTLSPSSKHKVLQVLNSFDLNSVQAGVCLDDNSFFCTESFKEWVKSRQLQIDFMHAGAQTLTRFFEKLQHPGNYGNAELQVAKCYAFIAHNLLQNYHLLSNTPRNQRLSRTWHSSRLELQQEFSEQGDWKTIVAGLQDVPTNVQLSDILKKKESGYSLLGQKYFERAMKWGAMHKHFDFVKIDTCYLVVPNKNIPELILDHPREFKHFAEKNGLGFFGSNKSKTCILRSLDPCVPKKERNQIRTLYALNPIQENWLRDKARLSINGQGMVPAEILIGAQDTPNLKYLEIYRAHRQELFFMHKCTSIRDFNLRCKQLYLNVEKVFSKDDNAFYGVLARIQQAVPNQLREDDAEYLHKKDCTRLTKEEYSKAKEFLDKGLDALTSIEFVEHCLSIQLRILRALKAIKSVQLTDRLNIEAALPDISQLGVSAVELITPGELEAEGLEMRHCVGGYDSKVANQYSRIFSLRSVNGERSTLELLVEKRDDPSQPHWFKIGQNRAFRNQVPVTELQEAASILVSKLNKKEQLHSR